MLYTLLTKINVGKNFNIISSIIVKKGKSMRSKNTILTCLFLILFSSGVLYNTSALESPTYNILMFVAHEQTYYSEYIVMYRALEAAGYTVDVRSSGLGVATTYMIPDGTDIVNTASSLPGGSYVQFTQQFQDLFGSPWDVSWDVMPATIAVNGLIQDVVDMSTYDALVVVGGTGAIEYQVDGVYAAQGAVSAIEVQAAAENLNSLALAALASGKPVLGQCHGASVPLFWRVPGTSGPGAEAIGYSLLKGGNATGFPEALTPVNLTALDVTHRPDDRVTVTSPHSSFADDGNGDYRIITTRDWYPQTIAHAAQTLLNILNSYPSQQSMQQPVSTLIIHGGPVDIADCSTENRVNDIPCNYGVGANTPADYIDVQNLLIADSLNDDFDISVTELNISDIGLPFDPNNQPSILNYLSQFDTVIYFKHWSTDMTDALQNALVSYADNGMGVLTMHHGMFNDIDGALNKDILVNQLFGVESEENSWSGSLQNFNLFSTNYGHFISTYGLSFGDTMQAPGSWLGNLPPAGASLNFSFYQTIPIFDEIYGNLQFVVGQTFGKGINEITPIFSNDATPTGQTHTAGFVKLFDSSLDGSIGRVAYFASGERKESLNVNHSYGQVIRNTVIWLANVTPEVDMPANLDPLSSLTDEFDNNDTMVDWMRLYQTENWSADPLIGYDINTTHASALTMVPSASSWWEDRIGALSYKEIAGDFIVSTNVHITNIPGNAAPTSPYSLAGLIVRIPQDPSYDAQANFSTDQQNYYDLLLGYTTIGPQLLYNHTQNSNSNNPTLDVQDYEIQIRLARVGDVLISLYREPAGDWQIIEAINWAELGETLQIGMVAISDWAGATSVSSFDHNNTAIAANEDLSAEFDYVRFRTPVLPLALSGQDLTTVSDTELLSFLGFNSVPGLVLVDVTPPNVPNNLIASNLTETSVDLSWAASIDNTTPPVTYTLFLNGVPVQNGLVVTNTSVIALTPDTLYNFSVSATDGIGNTSAISSEIGVTTVAPIPIDPLIELDDEFFNDLTLADWQRIYEVENWNSDPLISHNINTSQPSSLTMIPSASSWWEDRIGATLFKEITGDFVVTTNVRVTDLAGSGTPLTYYSLAGLIARVPQSTDYDALEDFTPGQQNYYDFLLGHTTDGPEILYNHTVNSNSNNPSFSVSDYDVEIRIARVGDVIISLFREPGGSWQVNEAINWPGLAAVMQVGMVAFSDWYGVSSVSAFEGNDTAVSANQDLVAEFDFIRFRTPELPVELEGEDLTMADDTALLSFLGFDSEPSYVENPALPWSDPDTWGGALPIAGENVTIPADVTILLDQSTPELGGLMIMGTLIFDTQDIELSAEWIMIEGEFHIGSEAEPFTHQAVITLTGNDPTENIMGMGLLTRGIMVMGGGTLELHGASPDVVWTKLDQHAEQGSISLDLTEAVDWQIGDEIVIAPTDYYGAANGDSITQKVSLIESTNFQLTIDEGLNAFRWGLLQYATNSGISLSSTDLVTPPVADTEITTTPLVLDERAEVGNLSRNIVIQAPDDFLWADQGFGVYTMIMIGGTAHVDGLEIRRAGQRGRLGRYPFHWHMLSYSGTDTLDDATGQYLRNSTINSSENRGIVIHGTNGVTVQNNIVYDVRGHGIFTEDAAERRNTIDGNLVLYVRSPDPASALKLHEIGNFGSSGFWISNPDNIVVNNTAVDCGTFGFWLAFTTQTWGLCEEVLAEDGFPLDPSRLLFGEFDNNTTHSNRLQGIMFDNVEADNLGNLKGFQYYSTTNGREPVWPYPYLERFSLSRYKIWKNGDSGIWHRNTLSDSFEAVSADNCGRFFAGAGAGGVIERSLVVGTSLNHLMNGTDRPADADFTSETINPETPVAFATYHSTFDIRDNVIVEFPIVEGTRSGAFDTVSYYLRPVDKGLIRNIGNLLVESDPGVKLMPPDDYYTLASALWDPYGIWGPEENYFVYDIPFLTYGKVVTLVEPGAGVGGVSVPGPFYGFEGFVLHGIGDLPPQNQPYMDLMGIHVERLNTNNLNEIIGTWDVATATPELRLQHMRDFATTPDGIYTLTFPDEIMYPTDFQMNVENMLEPGDTQVMGIQYDGTLTPTVVMQAFQYNEGYTNVNSLQEVRDSAGATWWQDTVNNMVWVKMRGGMWQFWTDDEAVDTPTGDDLLYETSQLRIYVP